MPTEEELKPVVEVTEPPPEPPGVAVDIEKKPEPTAQKVGESNEQYLTRLKSIENRVMAYTRSDGNTQRELREIRQQIEKLTTAQATPPASVTPEGDFWSQVDPRAKQEVEKLVEQKAQFLFQQREQERQANEMLTKRQGTLEESKSKVFSKYPQLHPDTGNEEDPLSQLYIQVVNQHPEWHANEYGPLLALQETEEQARQLGIQLKSVQPALSPNAEAARRTRVNAASLPPSRTTADAGKVILTRDEMDFCKKHNIPIEDFAKRKRTLEQGGGIEA